MGNAQVQAYKDKIQASVDEGHKALEQGDDMALTNACTALEQAKAAYRDLKTLNADATKNGVYRPIKELERAIDRKKQFDDALAAKALREAEVASRPVAVDCLAEQRALDKYAAQESSKKLSAEYRGLLNKISMLLEDGLVDMAKTELESARSLRLTANQARQRLNDLSGNTKKKPFSLDELKKLEETFEALMTVKTEQEAVLNTQRAWLSDYFGIKLDKDFAFSGTYVPRPSPNNRCAVCLAQAKRLIVQLGKQEQLMPLHEAMRRFLLHGFRTWGVQLCHQDAKQAVDAAGQTYGHRVFKRRPAVVDNHVNADTGEIEDLEMLEAKINSAVAQESFGRKFDSYLQDQRVLRQHAKTKARNTKQRAA